MIAFRKVLVYPPVDLINTVQWDMSPGTVLTDHHRFVVSVSHSGVDTADDWVQVATVASVQNMTQFTASDIKQRIWANADRLFYRVEVLKNYATGLPAALWGTLTTAAWTALSTTAYTSSYDERVTYCIEPAWGSLNRYHRLIAREIVRREKKLLEKFTGHCGYLFKRRTWGVRCDNPGCVDHDTDAPKNPFCPVCYGTGYKGGYYPALPFHVALNFTTQTKTLQDPEKGTSMVQNGQGRCLGIPLPSSKDFWLDTDSGNRWEILSTTVVAHMGDWSLVMELEMRQIEPTDVVYQLEPQ